MYELIIIAGAVVFAILGGRKGVIAQAASVLGFVAGFAAARLLGDQANELFRFEHHIVGYILTFLAGYLGIALLSGAIHTLLESLSLDWANHLLGALIGAVKWLMICSIVLNVLSVAGYRLTSPGASRIMDMTEELAPKVLVGIQHSHESTTAESAHSDNL